MSPATTWGSTGWRRTRCSRWTSSENRSRARTRARLRPGPRPRTTPSGERLDCHLACLCVLRLQQIAEDVRGALAGFEERAHLGLSAAILRFRAERGGDRWERIRVADLAQRPCRLESYIVVGIAERAR